MSQLSNISEKYRHECELRWMLRLSLQSRREHLAKVEEIRGIQSRKRLEEGLLELWNKR